MSSSYSLKLTKELRITLAIWAVLMALAVGAILMLNANASRILDNIYAVNVSRGAKAAVLYAAAEEEAREVLRESEVANASSEGKVTTDPNDPDIQKTIALFNQAFAMDLREEFDPGRTQSYELLGQVYDIAGQRGLQLLTHARAFMSQKNFKDARAYIVKAEELGTSTTEPWELGAQLSSIEGNTSEALAQISAVETSGTLTPKGHWIMANLLIQNGELETAATKLENAVKLEPKSLNYRRAFGDVLMRVGRTKEATKVLQEGLDDGGWMDAAYLHVYGDYLVAVGDYKEAVRVLKQADELAPQSGDVQWSLARAYYKAGNTRQAASALRRATEVKPELHDRIF